MPQCSGCGVVQATVRAGDEFVTCDDCEKFYCVKCSELTTTEVRAVMLKRRIVIYNCKECIREAKEQKNEDLRTVFTSKIEECMKLIRDQQQELMEIRREISSEDKKEVLASQRKLIEELSGKNKHHEDEIKILKNKHKKSYSQVLGGQVETVVLVKPVQKGQQCAETKKTIENKLKPGELRIGVSRLKYVKDGGIAISCVNEESIDEVCRGIREGLGTGYEVKEAERRNPRIKIFNVNSKEVDDEEHFIEKVIKQNRITGDKNSITIKILNTYVTKKERTNIVLELDTETYKRLNEKDKINIGWYSYGFIDHVNVIRCYKCLKFGHMAKECKSKSTVCSRCSEDHKFSECSSEVEKCTNCRHAVERLGLTDLDCEHSAFSRDCESYKRVFNQLQRRYNFPQLFEGNK